MLDFFDFRPIRASIQRSATVVCLLCCLTSGTLQAQTTTDTLLAELEHAQFSVRETATERAKLSPGLTLDQLKALHGATRSPEAQRRLQEAIRHRWVEAQITSWLQRPTTGNQAEAGAIKDQAVIPIEKDGVAFEIVINGQRLQAGAIKDGGRIQLGPGPGLVVGQAERQAQRVPQSPAPKGGILGVHLTNPPSASVQPPHAGAPAVAASMTLPGLPANAFLQPGDRILSVNGKPVTSSGQVRSQIQAIAPGESVVLVTERDGQTYTRRVRLGDGNATRFIATQDTLHEPLRTAWIQEKAALQTASPTQPLQTGPRRLRVVE